MSAKNAVDFKEVKRKFEALTEEGAGVEDALSSILGFGVKIGPFGNRCGSCLLTWEERWRVQGCPPIDDENDGEDMAWEVEIGVPDDEGNPMWEGKLLYLCPSCRETLKGYWRTQD